MDEIVDLLLCKLCKKGLTPEEIPRLVKDVLNILRETRDFTPTVINRQLETLGWGETIVDPFIFELTIALLDMEGAYDVKTTAIH